MRTFVLLFFFCLLSTVDAALPQAVRVQFAQSTNKIRSNLALGRLVNKNGTKLPAGRNVYQLIYSTQLEAEAAKWVDGCVYKNPQIANVAGNAIKLAGIKPINATTAITVVNAWLKPLTTQGLQSMVLTARDDKSLRGFVRMVWATSREVGCAIRQCPSIKSTLAVCLYSRAVVTVGKMIYGRGAACKENADCTSYAGSTCTKTTGLCYSKPPVPPATTPKPTTTTTKSTSTSTQPSTTTFKLTTRLTSTTTSKPIATTTTPPQPTMTESLKKFAVDLHNKFRSAAALGTLTGKGGQKFPQATGMTAVLWDDYFSTHANSMLRDCSKPSSTYGNVYVWTTPSYLSPQKALNDSIYGWAAGLSSFDPSNLYTNKRTNSSLLLLLNNYNYEHEMACSVKYCPQNQTQVACAYSLQGNGLNRKIYETGKPCSDCTFYQDCWTEQGLCSSFVNTSRVAKLTDAQRMSALNAHNQNRSTVAKGQAANKNGTNLPPATNMMKMTWSRMCESYAEKAVAPCIFNHTRWNNTGQSLVASSAVSGEEGLFEFAENSFYRELAEDGQPSLIVNSTTMSHFSQSVWANSKMLACSYAYCPELKRSADEIKYKHFFVACQYSPAGNQWDQKIYEPGPTCSACPSGSVCETSSGLCKETGVGDIHD